MEVVRGGPLEIRSGAVIIKKKIVQRKGLEKNPAANNPQKKNRASKQQLFYLNVLCMKLFIFILFYQLYWTKQIIDYKVNVQWG
jgi:hypothetical protein